MDDALVEKVARALKDLPCRDFELSNGELDELRRREAARAAIAALTPIVSGEELVERLRERNRNEASRRNSAYDRFGMDNTPENVDPDVWAAADRIQQDAVRIERLREALAYLHGRIDRGLVVGKVHLPVIEEALAQSIRRPTP